MWYKFGHLLVTGRTVCRGRFRIATRGSARGQTCLDRRLFQTCRNPNRSTNCACGASWDCCPAVRQLVYRGRRSAAWTAYQVFRHSTVANRVSSEYPGIARRKPVELPSGGIVRVWPFQTALSVDDPREVKILTSRPTAVCRCTPHNAIPNPLRPVEFCLERVGPTKPVASNCRSLQNVRPKSRCSRQFDRGRGEYCPRFWPEDVPAAASAVGLQPGPNRYLGSPFLVGRRAFHLWPRLDQVHRPA